MIFSTKVSNNKREEADILVIPFWKQSKKIKIASNIDIDLIDEIDFILGSSDFEAKIGETCLFYSNKLIEKRILLIGLGEENKLNQEKVRDIYGKVAKLCLEKKFSTINCILPTISELKTLHIDLFLPSLAEGFLSINYVFPKYGNKKKEEFLLKHINIYGIVEKIAQPILSRIESIFEGVFLTRDLVNHNADIVTPQHLAQVARDLAKKFPKLKVTVFDKKTIISKKMGLIEAVSKGAAVDPRFIILEYKGSPRSKDQTVLIGKGVTYDTGGLDLKPGKAMFSMKEDMSGAATVLGTMLVIASMNLKINMVGLIPATENAIGSKSYKNGDVYVGLSGDSVEIGSTDAEGRLILADAISYAVKEFSPSRIIDFATLTGAITVALGNRCAGLFSNNDSLAEALYESGNITGEEVWRLPLCESYKEDISSDIADIKNIGRGYAGSITAALFLEHFVKDVAWAHLDIAGTAYQNEAKSYWPKYASGFGVRLMYTYIERYLLS